MWPRDWPLDHAATSKMSNWPLNSNFDDEFWIEVFINFC